MQQLDILIADRTFDTLPKVLNSHSTLKCVRPIPGTRTVQVAFQRQLWSAVFSFSLSDGIAHLRLRTLHLRRLYRYVPLRAGGVYVGGK